MLRYIAHKKIAGEALRNAMPCVNVALQYAMLFEAIETVQIVNFQRFQLPKQRAGVDA